jgi:hypothetical protein
MDAVVESKLPATWQQVTALLVGQAKLVSENRDAIAYSVLGSVRHRT